MSIVNNLFNHKSNERMRQLIEAIRTREFSLQYSLDHLRGEERNLAEQINEVVNEFRETTLLQEAKYQYFGTMLDTINAFLIVADEQGKVHWMNRAAVDGLCGFFDSSLARLAGAGWGASGNDDAAEAGIAETGTIGDQDQRGGSWKEGFGCRKSECGEG